MRLAYKRNIHFGNHKLPKTTAIFNICAARDCPSHRLGLCQVTRAGHRCYALRDEQYYAGPLSYRRRQEKVWDSLTAREFADDLLTIVRRRRIETRALRLNEAGDFRHQADVDKAAAIARVLADHGIITYCYTARSDLDFSRAAPLVVNGSGFRVHGEFRFIRTRSECPEGYIICPGSCKRCTRCLRGGLTCVLPH